MDLRYFFLGNLNFQNGIRIKSTIPILSEAIKIGGTELFNAIFATGNALPWAAIMNSRISKCFNGII
jgi:hypothetical protein